MGRRLSYTGPVSFLAIDAHCDILSVLARGRLAPARVLSRARAWSPARARSGGLAAQVCAIYTAPWRRHPDRAVRMGFRMAGLFHRLAAESGGTVVPVFEARRIREIHRQRRLGLILSIEGAEALGGDVDLLRAYAALGVRVLGLAWNPPNPFATGCRGDARAPLSALGRRAVRLANALGVVLDVSHLNVRGFWDVASLSEAPFVATHSNARALCDHPRNLTDRQLRAVARAGGVVGAVFYARFVKPHGPASIADLAAHVDHMAQVMGIDHVGVGADFEGMDRPVAGLEDVSRLPRLFEALAKRFPARDLAKIAGLNVLRVFERVF